MYPIIAIVGRPNVGKSTLFNYLTKSRDALVANLPGLTRDRIYGEGSYEDHPFIVIDTGGLTGEANDLNQLIVKQTLKAISESDIVFFVMDVRQGVTSADLIISEQLRTLNKPITLIINKAEGMDPELCATEFYQLGFGIPYAISASHRAGIEPILEKVLKGFPQEEVESPSKVEGIKIAVVGRPNVGKSTLVNRMLGEERVVTFDEPGTTRDSIYIEMERRDKKYIIIDTAGVRRKSRIDEDVEKFSVIKTLKAIEDSHVSIMVIDARAGVTEQDLHLMGFILDAGKGLVIAINKWDGMDPDEKQTIKSELDRRLDFVDFAEIHFISALHGTGVGHLFESINEAFESATKQLSTSKLTKVLEKALKTHQPPLVKGRQVKLRYAHTGGHNPPIIVIHGARVQQLPMSYQRFLVNFFRHELRLIGTPIRLELKEGDRP